MGRTLAAAATDSKLLTNRNDESPHAVNNGPLELAPQSQGLHRTLVRYTRADI